MTPSWSAQRAVLLILGAAVERREAQRLGGGIRNPTTWGARASGWASQPHPDNRSDLRWHRSDVRGARTAL